MFKFSLKQLFRTPGKALLFFILMTASVLLTVFGAAMFYQANTTIAAVEAEFTTIGTVEQKPISEWRGTVGDECRGVLQASESIYGATISPAVLDFEGAEYLESPEYRPYYFAYMPDFLSSNQYSAYRNHILEFSPLEDSDGTGPVLAKVERVIYSKPPMSQLQPFDNDGHSDRKFEVCDTFHFCQHNLDTERLPLTAGTHYVAAVYCEFSVCAQHGEVEYVAVAPPFSGQADRDGNLVDPGFSRDRIPIDEVTENFFGDGGAGQAWLNWSRVQDDQPNWFVVLPASSLDLLPTFHENQIMMQSGRKITEEEFSGGAKVCMVTSDLAAKNYLSVGDKLPLSLVMAAYGFDNDSVSYNYLQCSPLDTGGNPYEPFWEAEYEIVGVFQNLSATTARGLESGSEIKQDTILIPASSVAAADSENIAYSSGRMTATTTSFQIENGAAAEFDAALRNAVPDADQLTVTYMDRGYSQIIGGLNQTRSTAFLLTVVGMVAAVVVVILLLYFFIARERKRTAIERSLGMTKRQCRASLLAGVFALTLAACVVGSAGAAGLLNAGGKSDAETVVLEESPDEGDVFENGGESLDEFDLSFSLWAKSQTVGDAPQTAAVPILVYFAAPLSLLLFVAVLAVIMVNINLRIEPVLLLSGKNE